MINKHSVLLVSAERRLLRGLASALLLLMFAQACATELAIPILTIAGKKKADVDAAIGEPTACEAAKQGRKCFYSKANTSVEYIDNKADWITVEALGSAQTAAQVLPALGLPATTPTMQTAEITRWAHVHGILEIAVIHKSKPVDYVLIKVRTP